MKISRIYIFIMAIVLSVMLDSCRQELCYDHYPTMDLRFSWEHEWERDYGMNHKMNWDPAANFYDYDELRPGMPEWVKMIRYYGDGSFSEGFLTPEGSKFQVEQGRDCSILFYNGDTEYIILSDVASLHEVRASATTRTRAGSSLQVMQEMYRNSRTTNSPDVIYSAYLENVPGVMNHEVKNLPIKMQPLVFTYLITFEFEEGIEHVALARGALGGMAEGVYLRSGVTTDETSIILFDCDVNSTCCRCRVRSFGIPNFPDSYFGRTGSENSNTYSLSLELKLKSGKTVEFNYDITDQMKYQPRGGIIKIKGIKVEDEKEPIPVGSGGFNVDVSGWDNDQEEIELPVYPFKN